MSNPQDYVPQNSAVPAPPNAAPPGMTPASPVAPQQIGALPAYMQGGQAQPDTEMNAGGTSGPRLSIRGKTFRFVEGGQERAHPFGQPLYVVILMADPKEGHAKNYYGNAAYQEGVDLIPICYSSDGLTPDHGCESPQAAQCQGCPHNVFGTALNQDGTQAKGKACKDFKRLFVVPYDQPNSAVYELRVPPTSFGNLTQYSMDLQRASAMKHGVITMLNFDANETSPVLTFNFYGYLDETTFNTVNAKVTTGELDVMRPSAMKSPAQVAGTPPLPPAAAQGNQLPAPPQQQQQQPQQPPQQQQQPQQPPQQQQQQPQQPPQQQQQQQATPCPRGAPAGYRMTDKSSATYQQFMSTGDWTDQLMLQQGYMVQG